MEVEENEAKHRNQVWAAECKVAAEKEMKREEELNNLLMGLEEMVEEETPSVYAKTDLFQLQSLSHP